MSQPEHVTKEYAIGIGIRAVDDRVCTDGRCHIDFLKHRT